MKRAVLFDLDGTLLDTLDDLADSMNAALERTGFPSHPVSSYRYFVGDGVDVLVRRVLPSSAYTPSGMLNFARPWKTNTAGDGGPRAVPMRAYQLS